MTWRVDVEGVDILCQGLQDILGIASKRNGAVVTCRCQIIVVANFI
jgi:hypothetical protein